MQKGNALFQLRADQNGFFDGSNSGVAIPLAVNAKMVAGGAGASLTDGFIEIARHKDLDALKAFTIEAVITPARLGPARQNILESQTPGIALFLSPEGKLVGSILVNGAWTGFDSGAVTVPA